MPDRVIQTTDGFAPGRPVPVYVSPSSGSLGRLVDPARDAIARLQMALIVYRTPHVPDASDPAGVVEAAINRLAELYLVATSTGG